MESLMPNLPGSPELGPNGNGLTKNGVVGFLAEYFDVNVDRNCHANNARRDRVETGMTTLVWHRAAKIHLDLQQWH